MKVLNGKTLVDCESAADSHAQSIPGYAICNIGDSLAVYSANILHAGLHRVV